MGCTTSASGHIIQVVRNNANNIKNTIEPVNPDMAPAMKITVGESEGIV